MSTIIQEEMEIPIEKCPSCGQQKRRLFEHTPPHGDSINICENCLMAWNLFELTSTYNTEKDFDIFARLNGFYSYKSGMKEQTLMRLLFSKYLFAMKQPNISEIKKIWENHYKTPIEPYIQNFQDIGIIGDINENTEKIDGTEEEFTEEIAEWGDKINILIDKFVTAHDKEDIDSWFYDVSNILKCAESMVGFYSELTRPTMDKNRNKIMNLFVKKCCDSDGNLVNECKSMRTPKKGGYMCKFSENGEECKMSYDNIEDLISHMDKHGIEKEDKDRYIERKQEFHGVYLSNEDIQDATNKKTFKNYHNALSALVKAKGFLVNQEINPTSRQMEWLISGEIALALEKAAIKTKEFVKEKAKELRKERNS